MLSCGVLAMWCHDGWCCDRIFVPSFSEVCAVLLALSSSGAGAESVSSSMLWEFALGILFELGDVTSMTGSTMLGLSCLDMS